MRSSDVLYCKIFVDSCLDRANLIVHIANFLTAPIDVRTICTSVCEIDVLSNDDFDEERKKQSDDGFLYYCHYLEIFPIENVSREMYVGTISKILNYLWDSNFQAVAACDFEDELPRKGGYRDGEQ